MGCLSRESCPAFLLSSGKVEDWALPDPKGKSIEEFRKVCDGIKAKVLKLIEEMEA
jgi:protein-tyrosine-phosphatase